MYSPEEMGADELTLAVDGRGLVNVSGSSTRLSQYAGETMRVMQSTGLKDKNGVEIFEGDVLAYSNPKHPERAQPVHVVIWHDSQGRFLLHVPTENRHAGLPRGNDPMHPDVNRERWAVIGNIYQNPELLPDA